MDEAVATRLERGEFLYDPAKSFTFLMWQSAVEYPYLAEEGRQRQLTHLLAAAERPNVTIRIVSPKATRKVSAFGGISIWDGLVMVEGASGEEVHPPGSMTPTAYQTYANSLAANALSETKTKQLLNEIQGGPE